MESEFTVGLVTEKGSQVLYIYMQS